MPTCSKFEFEKHFGHAKCSELIHPWEKSCSKAQLMFFKSCFVGTVKYYGIFYLISGLLRYKRWDINFFKNHLICYGRSTVAGTCVGSSFLIFSCYIRAILGRFYYNTGTFLPGTLGGFFIFIASSSKRPVICQFLFQLMIETLANKIEKKGFTIRHIGTNTIAFMILNAYLLYLLRLEANKDASKRKYPIWIFQPPSSKKSTSENPCPHSGSCKDYIYQGASTYFKYGCAIELCKIIIKNFSTIKSSPFGLFTLLPKLNIKAGLFAGGYVGIYRAVTCYLCQKYRKDDPKYALLGGLACGAVYPFYPLFNLLLTVVSSSAFVHIWKYEDKYKLPFSELIFALALGYSFNLRMFMPDICPNSAVKIISGITNGHADVIVERFHSEMLSNCYRKPT